MICLEAFAEGACVRDVARKYEVNPGQLYKWRQRLIENGDPPGDYGIVSEFLEVKNRVTGTTGASQEDATGADLVVGFLDDLLSELQPAERRSWAGQPRQVRESHPGEGSRGQSAIELRLLNGRSLRLVLTDDVDLDRLAALADLLERKR